MTEKARWQGQSGIYLVMGLLAAILIVTAFFAFYESYTDTREVRSEAYFSDRFYLAKKYLAESERWLDSTAGLSGFEDSLSLDTVIFLNAPVNALSAKRLTALLQFVNEGGHLIYAPYLREGVMEPKSDKLLQKLPSANSSGKDGDNSAEFGLQIEWKSASRVDLTSLPPVFKEALEQNTQASQLETKSRFGFGFQSASGEGQALISLVLGEGQVTLVNDSRWWLNKNIVEGDHALLLKLLFGGRNRMSAFWSPYSPSLWDELWRYYREFLVLFGLFIAFWLHAKVGRRQRVAKRLRKARRSLSEHIMAVGWLHWRCRNRQVLLQHLVDDIEYVMMKQYPQFRTQPENIKMQMIALNSNYSHDDIERLWTPVEPRAIDFVVRARKLKRLRTLL